MTLLILLKRCELSIFVGIDVSAQTLDAFVSSTELSMRFPNTDEGLRAMLAWLRKQAKMKDLHLVIEPTSTYHQLLTKTLQAKSVKYTLINPASTKAYARWQGKRAKTDRVDSRLLAQMGEQRGLSPTEPDNEAKQELKALKRHLDWLKEQKQAAANRLGSLKRSPWVPRAVLDSLEHTMEELDKQIRQVQRAIEDHLNSCSDLSQDIKLLTSIPGLGITTAVVLASEMPAVARCKNSKSWVAFCGVSPEIIQ